MSSGSVPRASGVGGDPTALAAVLAGLLVLGALPCAAFQEEVRTVSTRPGVTDAFFLIRPDGPPAATVILFTGGAGVAMVDRLKNPKVGGNFLVRNRRAFAEQGFLVAVIDMPSDHASGDGRGGFRTSKEHAQDVAAVIADLRREAPVAVWVVGTSMGTISAGNAAARLRDGGPDGLVLTSSVTKGSRAVRNHLGDVDLEDVRVPALVVHHEQDGCMVTPLVDARMLTRRMKKSPRKEFLTFTGGTPTGDPCEAFAAHGYNGIDAEVVKAISDWIKAAR